MYDSYEEKKSSFEVLHQKKTWQITVCFLLSKHKVIRIYFDFSTLL